LQERTVEKESLIANFKEWLKSTNVKGSGKASSYLRAIKMVFKFLDVKNIVDENEIQRIKQFQASVQNSGSQEYKTFYNHFGAKSYLENGFVSAGLGSFFEFYGGRDSNNRNNWNQIVNANIGKVVFVNLTDMKRYDGDEPETEIKGGGKFVEENKYGHELFNFRPDEGNFYGYCPKGGTCDIDRIAKDEIQKDERNRRYIDNVLVIFTATRVTPPTGRVIVGYYKNARVYDKPIARETFSRYIAKDGTYADYNLICDIENGKLLEYDDRKEFIPYSIRDGYGFGRSSMWYADRDNEKESRNNLVNYVLGIADEVQTFIRTNDERKYGNGSFGEGGRTSVTATMDIIKRSPAARQACLEKQGYTCKICGFNFFTLYGEIGKNFIEVHHLESLAGREDYADTDPEKDLMPVCSNCHSMLHKKRPAYTPDEIREKLRNIRQ